MAAAAFKAFSVVAAGIVLGALGSPLVKPVPKDPDPPAWQLSGRAEVAASVEFSQVAEPGAFDPPPYSPDSYAPSWADDPAIWQYPEPRIDEWEPEPYPSLAELDAELDEQAALLEAEAAEQAAAEAEEAWASNTRDEAGPTPGQTRKSELVAAGLY